MKDFVRAAGAAWSDLVDERTYTVLDGELGVVEVPFTFVQESFLGALGTPVEGKWRPLVRSDESNPDDHLTIDGEAFLAYRQPADATDEFVLQWSDGETGYLKRNPRGSRLDPIAARWLWAKRSATVDRPQVLQSAAWCTRCGRWFDDKRVQLKTIGDKQVRQYCDDCNNRRTRRLAPLRTCAAVDCHRQYAARRGKRYCGQACQKADRYRQQEASKTANRSAT